MQSTTPETWDLRTKLLVGFDNSAIIANTKILIVGTNPALSYASEFLVRAGAMNIMLFYPSHSSMPTLSLHDFTINQQSTQAQLLLVNPDAHIQFVNKDYNENLLKTHIAGVDVVVNGIEDVKMQTTVTKISVEMKKKIICIVGGYGKSIKEFQSALFQVGIKKGVDCIYSEEDSEETGGVGHCFCVMGVFTASQVIDQIITKKPIQATPQQRKKEKTKKEKDVPETSSNTDK
ncbi:Uncharacterized protein QTN25_002553 [Entamoeba marina]